MKKKLLVLFMVICLMFSVAGVACAADSNPYLTSYECDDSYVYTLDELPATLDLMVVPMTEKFDPVPFTSYNDAENVEWEIIKDEASNTGIDVSVTETYPVEVGENQYASYASVDIKNVDGAAAFSIQATDKSDGTQMNFTVVVNEPLDPVSGVDVMYIANGNKLVELEDMTVASNDYYDKRDYPNTLDVIYKSWLNGLGKDPRLSAYNIQDYTTYYLVYGLTFTINDVVTTYEQIYNADTNEYISWAYRVYDADGNIIPVSEYLNANDFCLHNDYKVVWSYGIDPKFADTYNGNITAGK